MSWRRGRFKGKEVWVEVGADGEPAVRLGRVPMRYSKGSGARIYRANINNVELFADGAIEDLADGVGADDGRGPKAKKGKKGSGFGKAGTRTQAQAAMARDEALRTLAALPEGTTVAFTDGGCKGNPGPAGSGAYIEFADGRRAAASRSLGRGTNNIAELTAIDMALDLLDEAGVEGTAGVALFSDSSYVAGVLTKGWKAKKNVDLIEGLRERLKDRLGLKMIWVAGHAGIPGNERADALATAGVAGTTSTTWSDA